MFQAEMEMKMYLGEDEGDNSLETNVLSSATCIETLVNMRTVYSKEKCWSKRRQFFFFSGKKGGLHANVREDFMDTETGIVWRDDNILEVPKATREIRKYMCYCRASSDSIGRVQRDSRRKLRIHQTTQQCWEDSFGMYRSSGSAGGTSSRRDSSSSWKHPSIWEKNSV